MTRRKNRLAGVETLYASRESVAGRAVAAAEQMLANAQQQRTLLVEAREQSEVPSGALGIGGLQNRAEFLRKLDQAIGQQNVMIERAALALKAEQQRYMHCRQRTMAIGKVNARRLAEQRMDAERRDQREQDAWRAPNSSSEAGES